MRAPRLGSSGLLPVLLVACVTLISVLEPRFLAVNNLLNILRNTAYLGIVSAGQMLVIIVGGFDLSVGALIALSSVITAETMSGLLSAYPDAVALAIAGGLAAGLAAGALAGAANGALIARFDASPFMVTLGMMSIAGGIAFFLTAGAPIYGLPDPFTRGFGRASLFGLPLPIYASAAVIALIWIIQNLTVTGRHWYAIGGNPHAATLSGLSVGKNTVAVYTASGLLAALTGILLTSRVGSGQAALGTDLMLESIAAAMIAGVQLRGGVGRVGSVAMGALFLAIVSNGLNLLRIDSKAQLIVICFCVVGAVAFERLCDREAAFG